MLVGGFALAGRFAGAARTKSHTGDSDFHNGVGGRMKNGDFAKPFAALALCVLLSACGLSTPGMVGNPSGGVVQPFPWRNGTPEGAYRLAKKYCRSFHKHAYLTRWPPDWGNTNFACVY